MNGHWDEMNPAQRQAALDWMAGPDDATVGEIRQRLAALADAPQCTELSACWCPLHGDCTCDREVGLDAFDCPLHSMRSNHPKGI